MGDLLYASGASTLSKLVDVATGSVLVSGGAGVAPAWSTSPTLSGNLTVQGNTTLGDALTDSLTVSAEILNGTAFYFEGATNDDVRTQLAITDPTVNRIIALPNASGTVALGTGTANYNAYWSGTNALSGEQYVALSRGGTNAGLTASNGAVAYSTASALALSAVGSGGQVLQSNGAAAPTWVDNMPSGDGDYIQNTTTAQTANFNGESGPESGPYPKVSSLIQGVQPLRDSHEEARGGRPTGRFLLQLEDRHGDGRVVRTGY